MDNGVAFFGLLMALVFEGVASEHVTDFRPGIFMSNLQNYTGPLIPCNQFEFCSERDRNYWKLQRQLYKYILEAKELMYTSPFIKSDSPIINALEARKRLCEDDQVAPFLANPDSDQWPIACVWNGGASNGTCSPAPDLTDEPFSFIKAKDWAFMVKEFRQKIGCSPVQVDAALNVGELYICRSDCLHLGLDYISSLTLSFGMILALTTLILVA